MTLAVDYVPLVVLVAADLHECVGDPSTFHVETGLTLSLDALNAGSTFGAAC